MDSLLLEGPGRHLTCISAKFMVDLANGLDEAQPVRSGPHQQACCERLLALLPATLRPDELQGNSQDEKRLDWLRQLIRRVSPGHLATRLVLQRLNARQQLTETRQHDTPAFRQLLAQMQARCQRQLQGLEMQLRQQDLQATAQLQCQQVLTRWQRGDYQLWSPAGRCFIALEELRWGSVGDALRLGPVERREPLLVELRSLATAQLAASLQAAPTMRHYYQRWLTTPPAPGLMQYKDILCWLGAWSDSERHPVSWSVTRTLQNVALGMPRFCSAVRLASAMVDEVFIP